MLPHIPCAGDSSGCPWPWLCFRSASPSALSPAVTHLLLLCCCPVDSAGAGRHRSVISLSHGSTKCSQTEGAVSDRLGKALGLTQIPGFRVRPNSRGPETRVAFTAAAPGSFAGTRTARAARVRVLHQDPQEGAGGAAEGRDGGAGLVTLLAVAAGSATGDSGWPTQPTPVRHLAPCP